MCQHEKQCSLKYIDVVSISTLAVWFSITHSVWSQRRNPSKCFSRYAVPVLRVFQEKPTSLMKIISPTLKNQKISHGVNHKSHIIFSWTLRHITTVFSVVCACIFVFTVGKSCPQEAPIVYNCKQKLGVQNGIQQYEHSPGWSSCFCHQTKRIPC